MATRELQLGSVVDTSLGRGVLRFYGPVANKAGKFAGVELYEPNGKNNGTVNGIKYFTCKANYGVFVKASAVTVVSEEPEVCLCP
jgi:dynactin 1